MLSSQLIYIVDIINCDLQLFLTCDPSRQSVSSPFSLRPVLWFSAVSVFIALYENVYSKNNICIFFRCQWSETCVAPDLVCDGIKDCPKGEDERLCIAQRAPTGTPYVSK